MPDEYVYFISMKTGRKSILATLSQALKQGTTPHKLAATCAIGVVVGIFPILGTTTLLCLGIAILLRLNIAILQLVNYLVTALQVLLILPFIQAGIYLFGLKPFAYTQEELITLFKNDFWHLLHESGRSISAGIGAWLLISVPVFILIYYPCLFLFRKWSKHDPDTENRPPPSL